MIASKIKKKYSKKPSLVVKILLLSCTLLPIRNSLAHNNTEPGVTTDLNASILIEGNFDQKSIARGLVYNENSIKEVKPNYSKIVGSHYLLVGFTIKAELINSRTSYSAVASDANGKLVYAQSMNLLPEATLDSYISIPLCEKPEADLSMQTQMSLLENLVKVREASRQNRQAQIRVNLTEKLLEKIKKTEESFGFKYVKELDTSSAPYEIVSRLNRVYNALKNYRLDKAVIHHE